MQGIPRAHKSMCEWCTYLGGEVLQLDPLRLTFVFEYTWFSLKGELKGKGELRPCKDFHCTPVLVYSPPSSFLCYSCLFALNWQFWWSNGVKGPRMIHLWILKTIELELLICPKYSYCKIWSLVGENFDYGKRGSFWHLINFSLGISLFVPKQACLT